MAITAERIKELERAEAKLNALEAGGVDNWEGYDFAMEAIRAEDEYEEFLESVAGEIMDAIGECIEEPAGQGCGYGIRESGYQRTAEILKIYKLPMKASK
jgi:hypothetical protein